MYFMRPSNRQTWAMMKAIDEARKPDPMLIGKQSHSKTDGLRVIRRFEMVNGVAFNPFSEEHLELVAGNAGHEVFFRKAGYMLNRIGG